MRVAICAFGTRGDVQPLALLAAGLCATDWCEQVTFVTHESHCSDGGFVRTVLPAPPAKCSVLPTKSPPVIWKGVDKPSVDGEDSAVERAQEAQQDACMKACKGAGLVLINMFALEGFHIAEKMQVPCVVCQPYIIAAPMPSSFAGRMRRTYPRLFRRLISPLAKRRSQTTPVQISSPESAVPAGSVRSGTPESVVLVVEQSASGQRNTAMFSEREETAWSHVEHWMWPLFTDTWGAFRARLGLHPCPLVDDEIEHISKEAYVHALLKRRKRHGSGLRELAPDAIDPTRLPPVLYLFSSLVVDESPFWPGTVRVCGYLYPPHSAPHFKPSPATVKGGTTTAGEMSLEQHNARDAAKHPERDKYSQNPGEAHLKHAAPGYLPRNVEIFLSAREDKPLFIGFGSMWEMCAPGYGLAFCLRSILLAARQAGARCLVSLPREDCKRGDEEGVGDVGRIDQRRELEAATEFLSGEFAAAAGKDSLLVHRGLLEQGFLLPRCLLAIHHGGSGTTAAVLRAGIPHVICPQHLDQFFWAERVQYLNVGSILERSLFTGREKSQDTPAAALVSKAGSAIISALTPQVRLRAACLGVKIRGEDGLGNTLDAIYHFQQLTRSERGGDGTRHEPDGFDSDVNDNDVCTELVLREMPNGTPLWVGKGAEQEAFFIYNEIFEDKTYSGMGIHVHDGDTLWDVGANVGLASIFFELGTDTPDSLNIYAFEPAPANRKALKRNLEAHCPRAKVFEYALGTRNEDEASMTYYPRMPGNSTFKPREKKRLQGGRMGRARNTSTTCTDKGGKEISCEDARGSFFQGEEKGREEEWTADNATEAIGPPLVSYKILCNIRTVSWAMLNLGVESIDLLKIDVEGSELDVLSGIEEDDWRKINQVVAEVHPVGDRVPRVCDILRGHGFHVCKQALGLDGTRLAYHHDLSSFSGDVASDAIEIAASLPRSRDRGTSVVSDRVDCKSLVTGGGVVDLATDDDRDVGGKDTTGGRARHDSGTVVVEDDVVYMVYARRL